MPVPPEGHSPARYLRYLPTLGCGVVSIRRLTLPSLGRRLATEVRAGVELFSDDDRGYLNWASGHGQGYVINIQRSLNPADARMHRADCYTINGQPPRGRTWTGPYIKICSTSLDSLDSWALERTGSPIQRCGTCQPPHSASAADATTRKDRRRLFRRS